MQVVGAGVLQTAFCPRIQSLEGEGAMVAVAEREAVAERALQVVEETEVEVVEEMEVVVERTAV